MLFIPRSRRASEILSAGKTQEFTQAKTADVDILTIALEKVKYTRFMFHRF
jgi:hypothetical protein